MSRRERDKGVRGEREVLEQFRAHGFTIRGLESGGDHLAFGHGLTLHVETKRQETARPWLWHEQASADAPNGVPYLVAFRRNHSPWLAQLELAPVLAALARGNGGGS